MVLKALYIIELTEADEGGLELVDPSWCPDEGGPPRKKVKSPPVISPTGSSTSLYSGGSSSIDWTTTGTTLEMQGTRVTRTQYGFRTLQESSAKMCLKVTGYPLPEITWFKDDVQLKEGERHTFYSDDDGFFALTIDPVKEEDTGRYTCTATNEFGQASTSAFFRVIKVEKEAAPPKFITTLRDQEAKEGDVITVECEVEGWPEPELLWLVDDQPLRPSHDFKLQYDGQRAKLEIRDAQPDDTGVYCVKIQNELGTAESKCELIVQPDPDKNHVAPEFQMTIDDVECNEGDEVRFKAVCTGDPNPEVVWYVNGVPLTESEKVRFISEDGICILTIKDVTRHFDGIVTCQAKNRLGQAACDAKLKVRVPPAPPQFLRPLDDKTVTEKGIAVFEVEVAGYPDPTVKFILKGKELRSGEDGVEIISQDGYYKVIINDANIERHDGEMIVRATNEHGTAESRARLIVEQEEESRSAPTFIKDIEDQTVKFGEQAVFATTVKGSPNPEVTWYVNGIKMDSNSPGVKIEKEGHDHRMTIDSARYAGTIACVAQNPVGKYETKARLIVLPQAKPKAPPRFTELLSDRTETEEKTVIFEVRVEGEPKPDVRWYINGEDVTNSSRVEIREFDGSIKLELKGLKLSDAGEIKAVATNSEGTAETKATLHVNRKPFPPKFENTPKSLTVEKGAEAVFEAKADGQPTPTYQWSINGRKVRDGMEGVKITQAPDGGSILTVDTSVHDSATISVVAENSLGADESGARLVVEPKKPKVPPPRITRDLKSQTVNKPDLAHFEVVVENATEIHWYLDGREITTAQGVTTSKDDQFEFRCSIDSTVFNSGVVSIKASNEAGNVETKCDFKVLEQIKETKKPEFTDKLRDMEVTKGDRVQMDVIALNSPQFRWMLNGVPLEDGKNGAHITQDGNKSTLIIDRADDSHTGKVTVEAFNEVGTSDSSAKLTVNPPASAPQITNGPNSMTISEKETVEFKCSISGFPEPQVKWYLDEKLLEQGSTVIYQKVEQQYSLKITETRTDQTGTIKVTAQNSAGQDSKSADLKVNPAYAVPKFKSDLRDKNVDEGEPVRFDVALEGPSTGTEVTWYLNGKPLSNSEKIQIADHGDGTYHITIAEAKPDMAGEITVKAKNPAGECQSSAKINISGGQKRPEFTKSPQDHETIVDESIKFSAIVTGLPTPQVSWYLNDKKLQHEEGVIKVKHEPETGKTSIRIYKPKKEQSGEVKVVAENPLGRVEAKAKLKVDFKKEVPKFTTNMDDRQVNEGDTVKYTTKCDGYPEPKVEWLLNSEPVSKHPNIKTTENDGEYTIEINQITPEQAGQLTCSATNEVGDKKQNVTLAVKRVGDAPTFGRTLEDRLITENEVTVMEAKLNAVKPKPTITWLRDGKEIHANDHIKLVEQEDGTLQLRIAETKVEDKGRITIKAENYFGSAETSASLGVTKGRPMAKPQFQSDIAPINLTEGDTLDTKLLITGNPAPFVKWYINGQLVCETEDTEITNANGVYNLKIHGVTADMTGKIKCVAYNKAGEANTEGPLKVVAPVPVEFETSLCDATCREGDTLKLKAVLLGEPTPVVSWYVNGKKLEESQNIKIHQEKGTYTVTIKDITCDYSGKVVCEAVNEYGTATSEATLLVLPRGEPPDFIEWLSNVRARTGSKVVHKVVFTGDPKPKLTWYINNKEVFNGPEYTIVTDDKTSTLTINSFNPDKHVGEIICKAENEAGEVSCTANMATYTSDMFSESESDIQEEQAMDEFTEEEPETRRTPTPVQAPKFITKLRDVKAKKGGEAIFECVVPDTKGVVCKWLKDGKELELIARIRVKTMTIEGHTTQKLFIDDVQPEDGGKYQCIVENATGKDVCEATLTVLEDVVKVPSKAPEFTLSLKDKTCKVKETVTFECKIEGTPQPNVIWFKDNQVVEAKSERIAIEKVDGMEKLTIKSAEVTDQGVYKCVAENEAGSQKTEAKLTVEESAKATDTSGRGPPEFIELLRSVTVTNNETAVLRCKVKGEPTPKIVWKREGKVVEMSARIRSEQMADGTLTLTVEKCTSQDAGEYRCEAENEYGSAWTEGPIIFMAEGAPRPDEGAPDFMMPIKPVVVMVGETATFEGKVVANPKPSIKWYKNGKLLQPDSRISMEEQGDGTVKLIIKDAQLSDTDEYRCSASNIHGDVWCDVTLTVKEPAQTAPQFTKQLQSQSVKQGEKAVLECQVTGEPQPTVAWFLNGTELKPTELIKIQSEGDGTQKLIIESAKAEHQGTYRVEARNPAGTTSSQAQLTVTDEDKLRLKRGLNDLTVDVGTKILLSVEVEGKPKTVKWYKGTEQLSSSSTTRIEKVSDEEYKLEIERSELTDSGSYRVVLSTDTVSVESSSTVVVQTKAEKISLPSFKKGLCDQIVPKGTPIALEIEVEGKPNQVKWYKGNDEVKDGKTEDLGNGKFRLTIPNFTEQDAGEYRVVAANDSGEVESKCQLTVKPDGDGKGKGKPEIVSGLVPTSVKQGETATFTVKVKGPVKGVKWLKNGREIPNAKTKDLGDGTYQLEIPNCQLDDAADYKVVVSNDDGDADSSAALTVKLPGLELVKGLEDTTVPKGETAKLEVKTNQPPKAIKWYKNGKELGPDDKAKPVKVDDNTYRLEIPDSNEDDTADYKVVLTGPNDEPCDSSCKLTVKLPEKPAEAAQKPGFAKGLEDQVVPIGSSVKMPIQTTGSPKSVKFYHNGNLLPADAAGQIKITKIDDNNYVLEIPSAALDNTGDYKCVIENDAGSAESSGKLTVEPKLTFLKPLKDQEITEGENAEFSVETNAKPRTVKWYKNGQEIKPDGHFVISGDDTKYSLVIKNAQLSDAGQIKVVLSNSAGDAESSANLTVKKAKAGVPKIVKGLEDQVAAKGASLVFEVKIEGEPTTIRWLKDGKPLEAGANIIMEKIDDQTYRLTIPKADLSDEGEYKFEAANDSGKATSDAKGEVDEKPEIVKGLEDLEMSVGDDDVLKVEVSAPVRTVKWYKNGQEIKPSSHFEPKKLSPKKYELQINKAELDDTATYKVVLGNAAGECDSSCALTVKKPDILKLLQGLKDVDVDENQPFTLTVKVEGKPKSVKWFRNGVELQPCEGMKQEANPEAGEYSLVVPSAWKDDSGAYRVELANDKGEVSSGSVVHVKAAKPKFQGVGANFVSPLEDQEVEEGEILTLKCVVGGDPMPECTWEKDGVELKKDDRITIRMGADGTATLRIKDAKKSDFGQYRITAKNEAGTATSACQVTVKDKEEPPSKPKFIIPLKATSAMLGEKAEFNVKIRAKPAAVLEWTLNGKPVAFDDRITVEDMRDGNWCLTIKDVREEDFGTLKCVAKNEHGSDDCSCEFDKATQRPDRQIGDEKYPPRFNVPLWDRKIPVNDPMFIECHVDARPTAEIEWFKDGVKIQPSSKLEVRNSVDGACRIRIPQFTEQDCGVYKCVATNPLGTADTLATYTVEVKEEVSEADINEYAPKFSPGLEDRNVNSGQPIHLSCRVDAIPKASVTFYKDGLPLRNDGRIVIEVGEDGLCTLSIPEAKANDEGAYRCVASNVHGSTNTACMVNVKVPKQEIVKEGEEPFFTKGLVDVWADRGETFTLKCAVQGDPFPEVKFYRNGQLVKNTPRTAIEILPDGTCSLTVKECTMSDEGIYRCEAENAHGKAKTQCTAHVQMAIGGGEKPKVEEGEPPRFIIPLSDTSVVLGGMVDLECKVTGNPMPTLKFSKDGGPIWEDPRYEWDIDEAKGTYHLRIRNATLQDEGTIRATATNEHGSCNTKSFIRLDDGLLSGKPQDKGYAPKMAIKLGDVRVTEGQPLKLECKIDANPLPEVTWIKDGAMVTPSDRIQITLDPDGTARLVIPVSTMDDDGIYRVTARNVHGSVQDKCTATVKRAPKDTGRSSADRDIFDANKAPKLLEPLENVKVPEKNEFKLRCKFSGEPKPSIKWFKDGERVFPYGRLQLNEYPDGVCELVVSSAARSDQGGYRCIAENPNGSARTTCDVTVIRDDKGKGQPKDLTSQIQAGKAPGFTIPLTIRKAKPGETVTFECLPFGTPFPNIKWMKDGIELIPGDQYKMESLEDGTQKLHVSDVTFVSEGYFRCVATNEHGTASTKAELVVEGDRSAPKITDDGTGGEPEESKPRIRRGLYNMSVHQGNVIEMIVCATGNPTPTVQWFKDGEPIQSDGAEGKRTIFTDERGVHHLVIVNAGPEDEGEYSLEATNKLGSAKTEGSLNIIRPRGVGDMDDRGGMPFPPGFVRQLKNKHVFNHMPTIFDCLVVGYPPPEVEWFHNGKRITPGGRIKIQSCGGGSHALLIMDTTLDDAGEYVAVATNCHGKATSSAILDVTVPFLDNIKFTGEIDVTPYLTEEYGFKKLNYASFPTPPDKGPFIKEVTGHYLTLSWIPTKRAPPRYPQVTYVIEIRELPEKEWTLLDYNIPEPVCKVRNLELGKSYQFRVRAENIYGISDPSPASPPSRLMAPPQPVFDKRTKKIIPLLDPYAEKELELRHAEQYACAPWFAPGVVEKRYCAENDTITIILNVQGYPDPEIHWKFRGWDIDTTSPTSKCKVYTYGGTETTLTISGFSKENVGSYMCLATNEYGEAQQSIMIDIATRPNFIQPLMNRTFKTNQPVKLDVRVEGQPFPELKWMKDFKPIVESARVKFVQDGPYLCSLIINDPMWRDSGVYSVVAINEAGQATTSATINVDDDIDMDTPRRRVGIDTRKVREIYEIEEEDEKRAGSGAPFRVHERKSERTFLAQLKPYDDALKRTVDIHNSLDHRGIEQYHQVVRDGQLALVVFENANITLDGLSILAHPDVEMVEPEGMDREKMVRVFMRQLLLALKHMHDLRIAHLDLRPEVILLQDTRLKLADFGQARRLLRGLITGEIKGTPEFVSPEIVRALPLTLATDMFSVGTLAYVLLTGISPFLGDNDNETLANVDRCQYDTNSLGVFSWDAKDFITKLLVEIPRNRLTVDEALDHPWLNDDAVKDAPLSADSLREFKYRYKWLERRVFVQQTPSEQIIEAILGPPALVAQKEAERKAKLAAEAARPVESYDYLRVKPRPPPQVEEVPRKRIEHQPYVNEFGEIIDPRAFDPYAIPQDPGFSNDYPPYERGVPQPPQPGPRVRDSRSRGPEPRDNREHRRPMVDQYGRPLHPEELLAKQPWDVQGRPIGMDDQQYMVDKYGRPVMPEDVRRAQQFGPVPIDKYGRPIPEDQEPQHHEKRKLIPQDKGETPSKMKREPPKEPPKEDQDIMKVPLRMIRGERREIEEEIANRILSDISEEGSVAGSLGSLDDFDMPTIAQRLPEPQRGAEQRPRSRSSTPKAESDASTPTLSPDDTTVKEGVFFPKDKDVKPKDGQPKREPDGRKGVKIPGSEIKFYPDTALAGLPQKDKELLERAENDPNIPVGCPLILEDLHGQGLIIGDSTPRGPSKKEKGWSKQGHKSTVVVTPSKEHSMEVLIATKRGKPSFLDPDEEVPDLDDEDARMDERKKKAKRSKHDGKDGFRDESDQLEKDKNRRTVDLSDLDKYRPKNFYKDDLDFERPDYDIDDDPWDSHYQIGPDTYLMATRGPAFNSRVRDYRRTLFGDGAPTVKQGFLGVRNRDVTVRERRRFTDILRESQQNLKPKSQNEHVSSVERAPSATAIERIKADIEKVAPSATKRNDDGTYAPIFISRLRDVYLSKTRPALFECSVTGSPAPKVQWTFQGKILENNPKYAIEQVNNIARLTVNDPAAFDLGEYVCSASNEYGGDKTTSRLISGEAPDRPGRPDAELASDTELFITWEPPEHVTYLEGITYRLEYRVAGPDDHGAPWITVSDNIDDEAVVVKHLQPLGIYQFRVTARNGFGLGLPSLTSRIVQTHGKGTPKLQIGTLRGEFRLNVVSIPHKSMEGISEESEEESIRTLLDQPSSSDLTLNTSDPKSRFQIDTLMFKGRFSVIRQAIDSSTEAGSHCIAKIRHPADNKAIQREFDTLRDSQHENVQVLIAAHTFNNFLYLFCERLYEDVFSRFVFNDYYNEEQIALTVRQIAAGLHFLHFRGVVHLDVNPHNVMFQSKRSWVVKLVDFGSAQYLKDAVKPEDFDVKWAAPEFHVKDTPVTVQSDMWGLGVIAFCLLAGFHPFTSEYDQEKEIKDNVLNVKCDPNLIPVNASQESLSFVTWALKKSPLRRMRTDEALSHRFLSTDPSMVRRREAIKYAASRLRKIAALTRQNQSGRPLSNELENTYGAKNLG